MIGKSIIDILQKNSMEDLFDVKFKQHENIFSPSYFILCLVFMFYAWHFVLQIHWTIEVCAYLDNKATYFFEKSL